jgi:hypothetical protein
MATPDGNTPAHRCLEALEPVVRRLLADNVPAETIIAALATLAKLTVIAEGLAERHLQTKH